jgi:hypothetical protein
MLLTSLRCDIKELAIMSSLLCSFQIVYQYVGRSVKNFNIESFSEMYTGRSK